MKFMLITLIIYVILMLSIQLIFYPETLITTAKAKLLNDLNDENPESINYYKYNYIYNGKILFEGPLTTKLIADLYFNGNTLDLLWYMKETGCTLKETLKIKKKEAKMKGEKM